MWWVWLVSCKACHLPKEYPTEANAAGHPRSIHIATLKWTEEIFQGRSSIFPGCTAQDYMRTCFRCTVPQSNAPARPKKQWHDQWTITVLVQDSQPSEYASEGTRNWNYPGYCWLLGYRDYSWVFRSSTSLELSRTICGWCVPVACKRWKHLSRYTFLLCPRSCINTFAAPTPDNSSS